MKNPRITRQHKLKKSLDRCFFICGYLGVDKASSSVAKVVTGLVTFSGCTTSVNERYETR